MNILRVAVHNFLGIKDFDAKLEEGVNIVRGANGSGKSSFLKAIWRALRGGGKGDGAWVIHRMKDGTLEAGKIEAGEGLYTGPVAEILVELDGGYSVRRQIAPEKTMVSVTKKEGKLDVAVQRPQAFLDMLAGGPSLNPIEFYRSPAAERRRVLLASVPALLGPADVALVLETYLMDEIDSDEAAGNIAEEIAAAMPDAVGLEALQRADELVMERRRAAWGAKEHAEEMAKGEAAKIPPGFRPPDAVPDVPSLLKRYQVIEDAERGATAARGAFKAAEALYEAKLAELDELKRRVTRLEGEVESADAHRRKLFAESQEADRAAEKYDKPALEAEIKGAQGVRDAMRAAEAAGRALEEAAAHAQKVRALDHAVRRGVREKLPAILWSRLEGTPLGALRVTLEGDRIAVGGVDIDNLSQSEQIRFSLAVARASAGELKTICVDGFEALDAATRAAFYKEAAGDGFQYIIAEVADSETLEVGQP